MEEQAKSPEQLQKERDELFKALLKIGELVKWTPIGVNGIIADRQRIAEIVAEATKKEIVVDDEEK